MPPEFNNYLTDKKYNMEKLIVVTFRDAKNATGGLNRLLDLDQLGDITIYNYAKIQKTGNKQFDLQEHKGPDLSDMPLAAAIGGSMIGLIAGPVGMVLGGLTGIMVGGVDAADSMDFDDEVLDQVKDKLNVGDFAIVLDIEEDDDVLVNSYIEPLQGVIVRTDIAEKYDQYDDEQWDELNKEIDEEEKSLKNALDKDKAAIKAKIGKLKKERDERFEKMKARSEKRKQLLESRIKAFDEKIKTANANAKDRLKKHQKHLRQRLEKINAQLDWAFA
jgi:uncharacterized membrane protein